jgi:hypothetical protein
MAGRKTLSDFVEDIVVETADVSKYLNSVAKEYNTKPHKLDFSIQAIRTFELDNGINDSDWVELDGGLLRRLDKDSHYANENLEYRQLYKIRIYPKDDYADPFKNSEIHLVADQKFVNVKFVIEQGSEFIYTNTFERDLLEFINKKKALNGIMLNIREKDFRNKVADFVEQRVTVLQEDVSFVVANGVPTTPEVNDKLEYVYRAHIDKQKNDETGRIDHSNKGYIIAVKAGDLIIKYTKALAGKAGRDSRGRLLKARVPLATNTPDFRTSSNIKEAATDKTIEYYAKKDGNVVFDEEKDLYDIEDRVETGSLSFKGTGSINAGLDTDVTIDVAETNKEKDAVGMGVKVTVSTLNIEGSVGENAQIRTNNATINGQTHKSSKIYAKEANIAVHKGSVFAEKVMIKRLEAGIVEAETVEIIEAVGGVIRAREVKIGSMHSHLRIYSSKKIEITNIVGSENLLVIDLEGYKDGVNEVEETKKLLTEAEQRVEQLQRVLKEDLDKVMETRKAFTNGNKRLKKYTKHDVEPPRSLSDKLLKSQEFLESYKEMKDELKEKKEKVEALEEKLEGLKSAIFDAEVLVHDTWKGYNRIHFKLVNPKKLLEKLVHEGDQLARFQIEKVKFEENKYQIITENIGEITH